MLLFMDGAGHYGTDQIDKKYTVLDDTACTFEVAAEGRFANCIKRTSTAATSNNAPGYLEITPLMTQSGAWTPTASGVLGFALKVEDLDTVQSPYQGDAPTCSLISLFEGAGPILHIALNSTGTFSVYRHDDNGGFGIQSEYLGSSIQGIRSNIWYYVEFKWTIASSPGGSVEIRVNGVTVLSLSGINTHPESTTASYTNVWTTARLLRIEAASNSLLPVIRMGDLYLADLSGSGDEIRDFVGDITVDKIMPESVGNSSEWTPLSGANWDNTEEVPPDDGVTYVTATTVSTRDTYTMQDVPAGTIPVAFQTLIYAKKETEGGASLQPVFRGAGADVDSNTQGIATTAEYRYIIQPYDTNPDTSATITEAEINAAEFGFVKVV